MEIVVFVVVCGLAKRVAAFLSELVSFAYVFFFPPLLLNVVAGFAAFSKK